MNKENSKTVKMRRGIKSFQGLKDPKSKIVDYAFLIGFIL